MDLLRAPWVLATIVVSAVWYWRGSQRPSLRAVGTGSRRRVAPWRGLCFAAGLAAVLVALDSPSFHPRLSAFGRVIYTAAGSTASWLLAIVLTIATTPLYPAQSAGHKGGLSPLGDQQLAAGVMLGPGSIPYAIVVFYWLYVWLGADDSGPRRRVAPRRSALGTGAR